MINHVNHTRIPATTRDLLARMHAARAESETESQTPDQPARWRSAPVTLMKDGERYACTEIRVEDGCLRLELRPWTGGVGLTGEAFTVQLTTLADHCAPDAPVFTHRREIP